MSFVISIISPQYGIVAGDTQLNDDNGKIELTGMKVAPVSDDAVIGFTGHYFEETAAIAEYANNRMDTDFSVAVKDLRQCFQRNCSEGNAIIIKIQNGSMKYAILDSKRNWEYSIIFANGIDLELLLPPDVNEDFCEPFFLSPLPLKNQVISCIKAVSKVSDFVNDKVYGVEIKNGRIHQFTDGIDIMDINYKHNQINK